MIGDWEDEWDFKRRGSDRSVNRHDACRIAAYLNTLLRTCCGAKRHLLPCRANKDMMKKLRPQLIGLLTDSVIALTRQAADQGEEG